MQLARIWGIIFCRTARTALNLTILHWPLWALQTSKASPFPRSNSVHRIDTLLNPLLLFSHFSNHTWELCNNPFYCLPCPLGKKLHSSCCHTADIEGRSRMPGSLSLASEIGSACTTSQKPSHTQAFPTVSLMKMHTVHFTRLVWKEMKKRKHDMQLYLVYQVLSKNFRRLNLTESSDFTCEKYASHHRIALQGEQNHFCF